MDVNQLKNKAQGYYKEAQYEKSLDVLRRVMDSGYDDEDVYFLKANILHINGKISQAINNFKKVLEINSDHTDAMISLSVLFNDIGKYEEAKSYFELADRKVKHGSGGVIDNHINKKFSALHFEIAEMYFTYGRHDEALSEFQKASDLDNSNLAIRIKIAKVFERRGFKAKALEELLQLKRRDPNYIPGRLALGLHYYSLGKVIEAQNEWHNILKKDPANKEARMYLTLSKSATEINL